MKSKWSGRSDSIALCVNSKHNQNNKNDRMLQTNCDREMDQYFLTPVIKKHDLGTTFYDNTMQMLLQILS